MLLCLVLYSQLEGIPVEGLLFPMSIIYLLMGCCVLLVGMTLSSPKENVNFFVGISPAHWYVVTAIYLVWILGSMYVSFKIFMSIGMFVTLFIMEETHSLKKIFINFVFILCTMAFFQIFFTNIMHIYFPEPIFE